MRLTGLTRWAGRLLLAVACCSPAARAASLTITDDIGVTLRLPSPAKRIVALAPHVAENLFAIGAGGLLVGTVEYSDYPPAAAKVARIGGYSRFDLEAIVAKKPDLVIGWQSGNPPAQIDQIKALGLPLYLSQPNRFEDVARELRQLGKLSGREAPAEAEATRFLQRLERLRAANAGKPKVRVFYQVWQAPLMTIGGRQIISSAIEACGGENVFASLSAMAAQVGEEAVLAADAEVFVAGGMGDPVANAGKDWLESWRRWKQLTAVKRNNLFFVPADLMQRHTPRLLEGAELMCAHLDTARARRPK
jgi:iron complex transport system substrate-binding protein